MAGLAAAIAGFGLGSIPFGYLLVRLAGRGDVRSFGSGNIGATNVARVLGPAGWLVTLLGDAGKGLAAVWVAPMIAPGEPWAAAAAGFGAIAGHCYTPWLGGRGGKGVATMLGAFGILAPAALVTAIIAFAVVALLTRYASAASILGTASLVVAAWALGAPMATRIAALATAGLIALRHRDNIRRLLDGTESRMGSRS